MFMETPNSSSSLLLIYYVNQMNKKFPLSSSSTKLNSTNKCSSAPTKPRNSNTKNGIQLKQHVFRCFITNKAEVHHHQKWNSIDKFCLFITNKAQHKFCLFITNIAQHKFRLFITNKAEVHHHQKWESIDKFCLFITNKCSRCYISEVTSRHAISGMICFPFFRCCPIVWCYKFNHSYKPSSSREQASFGVIAFYAFLYITNTSPTQIYSFDSVALFITNKDASLHYSCFFSSSPIQRKLKVSWHKFWFYLVQHQNEESLLFMHFIVHCQSPKQTIPWLGDYNCLSPLVSINKTMENSVFCRVSFGESHFNFVLGGDYTFLDLKDKITQRFRISDFQLSAFFPGHHNTMLDCDLDVNLFVQFARLLKCEYVDMLVSEVSDVLKFNGFKESTDLQTSSANASVVGSNIS